MSRIIITPAAKIDLSNIWTYIADDNLLAQISGAFDLISQSPDIGFLIEDIKPGLRCKPVKQNYLIFYMIMENNVHVARVLHSSRYYKHLLND